MSAAEDTVGRRTLLLIGAAATVHTACGGGDPGPYVGPTLGSSDSGSSSGGGDDGGTDSGSGSSSGGGEAGACGSCPSSGKVLELTFAKYPQLQNHGGSVAVNASGYSDPTCGQSGIVVFNNGGTYGALSTSCTHACCSVSISGSTLHCPCHGATFDLTGKPTNSVAHRSLASLPVCADACGVYVTT